MGRLPSLQNLTAEDLRETISYDPETGEFVWVKPASSRLQPGAVAGYVNTRGYRKIRVGWFKYSAHRLAWLYMTGMWPTELIDHINGTRSDNRWCNLREATHQQNMVNCRRRRRDLPRGVVRRGKKFIAQGASRYLGTFDTAEDAHLAYARAAKDIFGEFARVED